MHQRAEKHQRNLQPASPEPSVLTNQFAHRQTNDHGQTRPQAAVAQNERGEVEAPTAARQNPEVQKPVPAAQPAAKPVDELHDWAPELNPPAHCGPHLLPRATGKLAASRWGAHASVATGHAGQAAGASVPQKHSGNWGRLVSACQSQQLQEQDSRQDRV